MEAQNTVVLAAGAAIAVIVFALIVWSVVRRRARLRSREGPLPLISVSGGRGSPPAPPHRDRPTAPFGHATFERGVPGGLAQTSGPSANGRTGGADRFAPPPVEVSQQAPMTAAVGAHAEPYSAPEPADLLADVPPGALSQTALPTDQAAGSAVDGASLRYWRPADGTLQFLPGRLEVITGRDAGQEIRFVRTPGPDGTRVTFGRAEGAPYRHIQLREPTVSRAHARMTLEAGGASSPDTRGGALARWHLENLSATNPVVVNGRALAADGRDGAGVALQDGDRIEMGEVVFRFHAK